MASKKKIAQVAVLMGSDSDFPTMNAAAEVLKKFSVPFEMKIISAHRTPNELAAFAKKARRRGICVIIAGAGGAAHLPGMIAAHTELPVIGVPVAIGSMQGQDALLSIVQMPKGVPVATVGIGNAWNAGLLAVQILGAAETSGRILNQVSDYKKQMRSQVIKKQLKK